MKDQYFGDIQDYRKYGLLRQLTGSGQTGNEQTGGKQTSLGMVWMLTPSDGRPDGGKTAYLRQPDAFRALDPELFDVLAACAATGERGVHQLEGAPVLPGAVFFTALTPDRREERAAYMAAARQAVAGCALVFLDPDNGFEVASVARGRKNSSKYVYWDEVAALYHQGHSVLTYQHFPRADRATYTRARLAELARHLPDAQVLAFRTAHVGFFLAMQPQHAGALSARLPALEAAWGAVFTVSGP